MLLSVGTDIGVRSLAVLSDGNEIAGRDRDQSKIKELQGALHVQTRVGKSGDHIKLETNGSKAYNVTRYKLAKEHERI